MQTVFSHSNILVTMALCALSLSTACAPPPDVRAHTATYRLYCEEQPDRMIRVHFDEHNYTHVCPEDAGLFDCWYRQPVPTFVEGDRALEVRLWGHPGHHRHSLEENWGGGRHGLWCGVWSNNSQTEYDVECWGAQECVALLELDFDEDG